MSTFPYRFYNLYFVTFLNDNSHKAKFAFHADNMEDALSKAQQFVKHAESGVIEVLSITSNSFPICVPLAK